MRRLAFLLGLSLCCLTIVAPPGRAAHAAPINLRFSHTIFPKGGGPDQVFNLADDSRGGSFTVESVSLGQFDPNQNYPYPAPVYPLNQGFGFIVGEDNGQGGFVGPTISLSGTTDGFYQGPQGVTPRMGGHYTGIGTSAHILDGTPGDLPLLLLDWLNHPEHVRLNASVGGGSRNMLDTTLTYDTPSVPEPATWAAWGLVGLGALAARRRRRTRACI